MISNSYKGDYYGSTDILSNQRIEAKFESPIDEQKIRKNGSTLNAIEENYKICSMLEQQVAALEEKISLILVNDIPTTLKEEDSVDTSTTILERQIRERNNNLMAIVEKVRSLTNRVSI